ncbi:MAG: acetolactate synthase 2 catalytic subunit [Hahellaceae bacterium]|nr:acetolactate synthase 2 catalytic subunit [Hahellaceae bacterium]
MTENHPEATASNPANATPAPARNGAEAVIERFVKHEINTVFGYPGGCIMPLYDAFVDANINHILCRHEQGCALAADGYARASGRIGVCIATSGPGATNLITGVANAFADSIPLLVITGQVPTALIGTDAFQETDILGMTLGIVKHSYLVTDANALPEIIDYAITLAQTGRPGPVWIDIPKDILLAPLHPPAASPVESPARQSPPAHPHIDETRLAEAIDLIQNAKRPVLYSGGGITLGQAHESFAEFVETTQLPSVVTLKGIGNTHEGYAYHLGMLGMHGSRAANLAVQDADLLICIGARFDDRATGKIATFAGKAKIIHIDIDNAELGKLKPVDVALRGHLNTLLPRLTQALEYSPPDIGEWREHCRKLRQTAGFRVPANQTGPQDQISGPAFVSLLSRLAPEHSTISCDVGQHQMWVAQYAHFTHPRQHLSSGGLGTMGYGLPAAIGAQFAHPQATVINVSGDGSFMMNLQELGTLKRYGLPIKIIILDNQCLGMVRQQQELFYQERYSEIDLSDNPDFCALASAFGIASLQITQANQMRRGIETLFAYPGAMLLHVAITQRENVWPMVAPGACNSQMLDESTQRTAQ